MKIAFTNVLWTLNKNSPEPSYKAWLPPLLFTILWRLRLCLQFCQNRQNASLLGQEVGIGNRSHYLAPHNRLRSCLVFAQSCLLHLDWKCFFFLVGLLCIFILVPFTLCKRLERMTWCAYFSLGYRKQSTTSKQLIKFCLNEDIICKTMMECSVGWVDVRS